MPYLVCIQTSEAEHSNLIRYMGPVTSRTFGEKTKLIIHEIYKTYIMKTRALLRFLNSENM